MRLLALLLITAAGAFAQTASTQILGLVTDSTGAVVPGATITAKRIETGDVRTTTSNETGNYIFPLVDSGAYEVTCAAAGFKTEVRRNIPLELNQKGPHRFPDAGRPAGGDRSKSPLRARCSRPKTPRSARWSSTSALSSCR